MRISIVTIYRTFFNVSYELTLRSKLNRLKLTKRIKSGMQGCDIEFGFKGKVMEFGGFTQPFKFDIGTKGCKQTVGLVSPKALIRYSL